MGQQGNANKRQRTQSNDGKAKNGSRPPMKKRDQKTFHKKGGDQKF